MRRSIAKPQFDRDIRRLKRRGKDVEKLIRLGALLERSTSLSRVFRPHKLSGAYEGLWECHIEHDWLLIYEFTEDTIVMYRTGSHAGLFE